PPSRIRMITLDGFESLGLLPAQRHVLLSWMLTGEYGGFLVLGEKLTGQPLDEGDTDLLLGLTQILKGAMTHALAVINIQQLNADLVRKNETLQQVLGELRSSREELDRRIFHLGTLSDLGSELSPLLDLDRLIRTFLMMATGSMGAAQGLVLVQDRQTRQCRFTGVGLEREVRLEEDDCDQWIYRAFEACEVKSLAPGTVSRVHEPLAVSEEIPIDARLAFFLVIDSSRMGLLTLGPRIQGGPYSPEEVDLLETLAASLLVYLKNAVAFETIENLNAELVRSNEDLRQTIAELTEARHRITILERARAHLRALVRQEAERVGRASWLDYALILLLATVVGVLFNLAAPQGIPLVQETLLRPRSASMPPQGVARLVGHEGAVLVDARPRELHDGKRIPGAVNVPLSLFDVMYMMKLSALDSQRPIVVYGRHVSRLYDEEVAFRLRQRDHENVWVLEGGLEAWAAEGLPVQ
ncbi:MAG: rhodanese-like domain-containing protein, partial [Syntrophobacteraceae bacterium]|nr:rhodanese-like domain-containing protein [Syntrophobacteraceae bacterium]